MNYDQWCNQCKHYDFNFEQGIICGLTQEKPNFNESCDSFILDENKVKHLLNKKKKKSVYTASKTKRLINYILDTFFYSFFSAIVLTMLNVDPENLHPVIFYLILISLTFIYYFTLETLFGRSIAKIITATKTTTLTGDKPSVGQIIIRTISRFIPFEQFSFLNGEAVGWHDKISGTRVIDSPYFNK